MAHSVTITTPMPTWEETVERYGLSKADQKFVIRLVDEKVARRPSRTTRRLSAVSPKSVRAELPKNSSVERKKADRASTSA